MAVYAHPGETLEASAVFETGLVGTLGFQIIDTPSGGIATARTTLGIVERPIGSGIYHVATPAPTVLGTYSIVWDDTDQYAAEELIVALQHPASPPAEAAGPTFATLEDVASRLGRALTALEEDQVEFLLLAATEMILAAVDKDEAWALATIDVPPSFRFVCTEMVVHSLNSVPGVQSTTESLGAYSYTNRAEAGSGLVLTSFYEAMLRRAVWGQASGSATVESIVTDVLAWPNGN